MPDMHSSNESRMRMSTSSECCSCVRLQLWTCPRALSQPSRVHLRQAAPSAGALVWGRIQWRSRLTLPGQELRDLCKRLLVHAPAQRLCMGKGGTADLTGHPWFSGFDWAKFRRQELTPPYKPKAGPCPCGRPALPAAAARSLRGPGWQRHSLQLS